MFDLLPGREWEWAALFGLAFALRIVMNEVDAMRTVYGVELTQLILEANQRPLREAIAAGKIDPERPRIISYLDAPKRGREVSAAGHDRGRG